MQREPSTPVEGGFAVAPFVMESAKELSEFAKFLPDTVDLPTTHEHYVETHVDGRGLTVKHIGVRLKPAVNAVAQAKPVDEADGLNKMSDADLETEAAKVGVLNYPKGASKAKRVEAVRLAIAAKANNPK